MCKEKRHFYISNFAPSRWIPTVSLAARWRTGGSRAILNFHEMTVTLWRSYVCFECWRISSPTIWHPGWRVASSSGSVSVNCFRGWGDRRLTYRQSLNAQLTCVDSAHQELVLVAVCTGLACDRPSQLWQRARKAIIGANAFHKVM